MKREMNAPSSIFFSPPSPTIAFNSTSFRSGQRQSQPTDLSRQTEYPNRYSTTTDASHSSNAFAHLRSEISNLRSEFTRLIQQDSHGQKTREDRTKFIPQHKEDRVAAHSTIGFYNLPEGKGQQKGEFFFKGKGLLNDQRNQVENGQAEKKGKLENATTTNKYHKKYSFQVQDRRDQTFLSQVFDSSKIQELEVEIRKLGDAKHKVEEENAHLRKELFRIEKDTQNRISGLQKQNQSLRSSMEQYQISISLKQSLVEKLQNNQLSCKNFVQECEKENRSLRDQLDGLIKRLLQLQPLQSIILDLQQKQQVTQQLLKAKSDQCSLLNDEKASYQQRFHEQVNTIEIFQRKINELQTQHQIISQQYEAIQSKYQPTQNSDEQKVKALQERCKALEDENTDLKKRVESYKKTVEQLNAANNSTRQKLVGLKEEARKGREDAKFFAEELQVKEKLISSLYRDINILDNEIRHNSHLKAVISNHVKYIEELTQNIIELECQQLNNKYSSLLQGGQEQIQYS